ncbi:MAG: tRNA (guanosine(46)-N7)-methyltransferase TrmB [Alphaproteobacteria bacterium]|nr:tRNA (guanosine(46)-N7)-methyltransferase TrmB [Alphaproteobacteria bacterium]
MNQSLVNPSQHRKTLYGRRQSRPLKDRQKALFDALLPSIIFSSLEDELFSDQKSIWVEIGFGSGEHLCKQALSHPDVTFIGCEPFVNGVASLLSQVADYNLKNIKIFQNDARFLLETLPSASLDKVILLFPDPWPKKRHFKRRFVQKETIKEIHRLLKQGGEWRIATDHEGYAYWVDEQFKDPEISSLFTQQRQDIYVRPDINEWPETRYEEKAKLEFRKSAFFSFTPAYTQSVSKSQAGV